MLSFKPAFSLSSFNFIKWFFSSSSLSAIRVVSFAYLRLLIFLPAILIPACASSSPVFCMMYSAYKLISRVTIYSLYVLLSQFGTSAFQDVSLGYIILSKVVSCQFVPLLFHWDPLSSLSPPLLATSPRQTTLPGLQVEWGETGSA